MQHCTSNITKRRYTLQRKPKRDNNFTQKPPSTNFSSALYLTAIKTGEAWSQVDYKSEYECKTH